jgi:hypothetical protein
MANAGIDQNNRPTLIAASKDDGETVIQITADPSNHGITVEDDVGGADNGNNNDNAQLDENSVPVATALASDGSGRVIEVYGDPLTGALLINSN